MWEWVGFTRRDNAKKFIVKNFEKHQDYVTSNLLLQKKEQVTWGGHNKETIMMNVDTFKAFCMTANTDKGKQTRKYYIKMENVFFQFMEIKNKEIIQRLQVEHKKNLARERHENLKRAYKNTPCVYILLMSQTDDDNMMVKIGETDDIVQRVSSLRQEHKEYLCILFDVFPCDRPHKLEQFLLNKNDIKEKRIGNTEFIQIDNTFTYKDLVKTIERNIEYFKNISAQDMIEINKLKFEQSRCQELTALASLLVSCNDDSIKNALLIRYNQLLSATQQLEEIKSTQMPPASTRKVYKFDPSDLKNPINKLPYASLKDAARSLNDPKIHDYHIRGASMDHTVLNGFRWFYVDDDQELPEELPPTKDHSKPTHRKGLVAQISPDKTRIINIYPSQKAAASLLNIAQCSITSAITRKRMTAGYHWEMYGDCDEVLKGTFDGEIPEPKQISISSKKIERIDPDTNQVIEVYACIQDVCSIYKTCHKTINNACKSGNIYKGFQWKYA